MGVEVGVSVAVGMGVSVGVEVIVGVIVAEGVQVGVGVGVGGTYSSAPRSGAAPIFRESPSMSVVTSVSAPRSR